MGVGLSCWPHAIVTSHRIRAPKEAVLPVMAGLLRHGLRRCKARVAADYERRLASLRAVSRKHLEDPLGEEDLREVIALLRRHGSESILLMPPTVASSQFFPRRVIETVPTFDMSDPAEHPELYAVENRGDGVHLSSSGAELFSRNWRCALPSRETWLRTDAWRQIARRVPKPLARFTADMLFVEFRFFIFFAVVFGVHWTLRSNTARKWWLLLCNHIFYACFFIGEPSAFFDHITHGQWAQLPDGLVVSGGALGVDLHGLCGRPRALAAPRRKARRKAWLLVSLVVNLGVLCFFKYFNFFVTSGAGISRVGSACTPRCTRSTSSCPTASASTPSSR